MNYAVYFNVKYKGVNYEVECDMDIDCDGNMDYQFDVWDENGKKVVDFKDKELYNKIEQAFEKLCDNGSVWD